jgi:hypothetical protein
VAFFSLQVDPGETDTGRREARKRRRVESIYRVLEPIVGNNESFREWARRHGIKL